MEACLQWGHMAFLALTGLPLLPPPAIFWFNWQIYGPDTAASAASRHTSSRDCWDAATRGRVVDAEALP